MKTKLISITKDAESLIAYCARVSSNNQMNTEIEDLLHYCWNHGHVSIFEQAHMTVEIETTMPIATQILRHRSFTFQQFSQRYNTNLGYEPINPRRQASENRQSSIDDLDVETVKWFQDEMHHINRLTSNIYKKAIEKGVSRESARFMLPQNTTTRMYMTGNIRSWMHYVMLRTKEDTQLEHRYVANSILKIMQDELPIIHHMITKEIK